MGAVGAAEGVVDIDLGQSRQLVREAGIVPFLPGVEAEVLEESDAARLKSQGIVG
jgi:hypothetical protein